MLRAMVEHVIARGLPRHSILNVNFPDRPLDAFAGIRPARLGGASCYDRVFLCGRRRAGSRTPASLTRLPGRRLRVFRALRPSHGRGVGRHRLRRGRRGCVAVTPLRYDLLDAELLADLAAWDLDLERLRA